MRMRTLALCAIVLAGAATAFADPAELTDLRKKLSEGQQAIDRDCEAAKKKAVADYGANLAKIAEACRQAGDLDGFVLADAERKRYEQEKTVPSGDQQGLHPLAAKAATLYEKVVADAGLDRQKSLVALLAKHVASVKDLVKRLVQAGQIEDAKVAGEEQKRAEFAFTEEKAKLPAPTPAAPVQPAVALPNGVVEFVGHYYAAFEVAGRFINWTEARDRCTAMGGHLATIGSHEENRFVWALAPSADILFIGAEKRGEDSYRWTDGTPMRWQCWFGRDPWFRGFGDSVIMIGKRSGGPASGQWRDVDGGCRAGYYVCEWESREQVAVAADAGTIVSDAGFKGSYTDYAQPREGNRGTFAMPDRRQPAQDDNKTFGPESSFSGPKRTRY